MDRDSLRLVFNPLPTLQRKLFHMNSFSIPKQRAFPHRAALAVSVLVADPAKQEGPPEKDGEPSCLLTKDLSPARSSASGLWGRKSHFIFSSKKRSTYAQHES